jgi:hypothetical protein
MSNLWVQPEELGEYADSEFAYEAAQSASGLLWALSGRRYSGVHTVTERYICTSRAWRYGASIRNYRAELLNGSVYNIPSSNVDFFDGMTTDGISNLNRVRLRGKPVTKVHVVRTRSGDIINPSLYYLVDHSTLQAVPGTSWTSCNIDVTYSYGMEPPTLGKMAARLLAIEFAKLWSGSDDCILPQRVTSISRQGVSYTLLDSQDFIDELRTGLYSVDLFLKSVNPDRARNRARVFSPDMPRARRYTPKTPRLTVGATDIVIVAGTGATGSFTADLIDLGAEFLITEEGWTTQATIYNYGENKSLTLDGAVAIDEEAETLTLTVGYTDAVRTLGNVDPGTWEIYASRPDPMDPEITETIFVASANLTIQMAP